MIKTQQSKKKNAYHPKVLFIDKNIARQKNFVKELISYSPKIQIKTIQSSKEWLSLNKNSYAPDAVIVAPQINNFSHRSSAKEMKEIMKEFSSMPIIVLSETSKPSDIWAIFQYGIRGYITPSINIKICIKAIHLIIAGGIFIPEDTLIALYSLIEDSVYKKKSIASLSCFLTPREIEIAESVCVGKANKTIAYELNISESTIKIHMRTIMKKLNATNRTEVAYKIHQYYSFAHCKNNPSLKTYRKI